MISVMNFTKAGAPTDGVNERLTLFSGVNTIQSLALGETPTGGHFHLIWHAGETDEATTGEIAFNATGADVKAALVALDAFVTGDITASATTLPGQAVTLEFTGAYAAVGMTGIDVPLLTTDATALTGEGNPPTAVVTKTQGNPSGGTFTLSLGGQTTDALAFDCSPSTLQGALESLSTIGIGNVICNGAAELYLEPQTIDFIGNLAGTDIGALTADDTNLVSPQGTGEACTTITETVKGVDGDWRGAPTGSICLDTTNNDIYYNSGTPGTPVWSAYPVI